VQALNSSDRFLFTPASSLESSVLQMLQSLLLAGVLLGAHVGGVTHTIQCDLFPSVCNHKCYATYVAGKPSSFLYSGPLGEKAKSANRKAAGTKPNPCKCRSKTGTGKITAPTICYHPTGARVACTSPDEYPYASTPLGGQGSGSALIRCTGEKENTQEGQQFGNAIGSSVVNGGCGKIYPCSVSIAFASVDGRRLVIQKRFWAGSSILWLTDKQVLSAHQKPDQTTGSNGNTTRTATI
jgi:hypothetical protein